MPLRGKLALVSLLFSVISPLLQAQSQTTGRITGTIQDAQSRPIPKAQIVAIAKTTGEIESATTNESGTYVLLSMRPGEYEITVSASGFARNILHGITVPIGTSLTVNTTLQIAQSRTEIDVNDAPKLIQTDSAVIATSLNPRIVQSVPLSSRKWTPPGAYNK